MKRITRGIILPILTFAFFILTLNVSEAAIRVRSYVRKSTGTYVMPHYKTRSDTTRWNNYSTKGNYNPYTGKKGYTSPYKPYKFK